MANNDSDIGAFLTGFVIGGLVGAAVALILAPQSGEETRAQIRQRGIELKDRGEATYRDARARVEQTATDARTRAEQLATEAKSRAEELAEKGRTAVEEQRTRVKGAVEAASKSLRRGDSGEAEAPAEG